MQQIVETIVKFGVTFLSIARHLSKGRECCKKGVNKEVIKLELISEQQVTGSL